MEDRETKIWNCLIQQDGETVARLFTQYRGMQLFDEGFLEHLVDEGYLEADEDEEEDDDEDPEDEYPDDGDYIMSDCDYLGSKTFVCVKDGRWNDGKRFRYFGTEEEAVKAIKEDMAAQQYWPNVWYESDHGNMSHYNVGEYEPRR
ncbi:hypothetical protein FACS1894109_10960 [Spirochaetia bacterium]|nr:hypothetical protein FACS1894109_10960 [Spirochaetia bacterium]